MQTYQAPNECFSFVTSITLSQSHKLKLLRGPNEDLESTPTAALWSKRNNGGNTTSRDRNSFYSYFLRKVSWITGKSFLLVSTFS